MTLSKTYRSILGKGGLVPKCLYDLISEVDARVEDVEAGIVPEGSISSDELANGAVVEAKLGTGAVTSGKIADASVTAAKLRGDIKGYTSAGVTTAALTSAIADPATLSDNFIAVVTDSADSNKIKIVTVKAGAFYVSAALTAAA